MGVFQYSKNVSFHQEKLCLGTWSGTRTHSAKRPRDFKSLMSTGFIIQAESSARRLVSTLIKYQ